MSGKLLGRQYYLFDALGSTVNLTKPDGSVQARYQYDAWGNFRAQQGSTWNDFTFTGHEKDTETGLYYFKARYYDPDTARFISQDAYLGETGTPPSLHRYLYAYSNPTVYVDPDGNKSVFGDATKQLEEFKDYLGDQNVQADSQLAAVAIGTAQLVATLGQGITAPLDIAANVMQEAVGVDDQQVRDELAGTRNTISNGIDFAVNGDYLQAGKNVHQAAVNITADAMSGDVTATANITQAVIGAALLKSGAKNKAKLNKEGSSGPATVAVSEASATHARIKANVAASQKARNASNMDKGLSYAPAKISGKNAQRLVYERKLRGRDKNNPKRAQAGAREVRESFVQGSISARRGQAGEAFEAYSGIAKASFFYLTKGKSKLTYEQRQHQLALPVTNTANNMKHVSLRHEQLLLEGLVAPQKGTIFGPVRLNGGGYQAYTESGRFGSVRE